MSARIPKTTEVLMARTPLLRALRQLAEEHQPAGRPAWRPARRAPRRSGRSRVYSRRRPAQAGRGVAGAAGLCRSGSAFLADRCARSIGAPRIAIVGGGIAGLGNPALTLADAGVLLDDLRGRHAINRRTHALRHQKKSERSCLLSNGQVSEFCGELIDTGHHNDPQALAQTVRADSRRPCSRRSRTRAPPTRSTSSAARTPVDQADAQ